MADNSLADIVSAAGYEQVEEVARTETSTLYRAQPRKDSSAVADVEVEEFNIPLSPGAAGEVEKVAAAMGKTNLPGVFSPRIAQVTDAGKLVVVRDAPAGMPLKELARERFAKEGHFNTGEVLNLLLPVAEAIDHYAEIGQPGFVSRSINLDRLLAQPGWASAPVKMSMVGPTAQIDNSTAGQNRVTFIELVADLTGLAIDPEMVASSGNCQNYLRVLAGEPIKQPRPPRRLLKSVPTTGFSSPWPAIAVLLALLLLLGSGLWWWINERGQAWEGEHAALKEAYPELISSRDGGKGWQDLTCHTVEPEQNQTAKIRCAGESLGVSIAKYVSEQDRDAGLPGKAEGVALGSGSCMINSFEVPGVTPPAFVMAPEDRTDVRILINGANAEDDRLQLPLCPGQ
ncbi:hypothetical protein [Corynebacterium mayonis]|uniref:hypothetical protein n=1 Tax=Corynebacterium mayonis TaxID=3062461 RepID=UPI00314071B5